MKIRVLFFASLREAVGVDQLSVELEAGNFNELRKSLSNALGPNASNLWVENVRLARNQELVASDQASIVFEEGDELAFLPPVTGG